MRYLNKSARPLDPCLDEMSESGSVALHGKHLQRWNGAGSRRTPSKLDTLPEPLGAPASDLLTVMNQQSLAEHTDQQLIDRIVQREAPALSDLYDRYSKLLYGIILAVVHDTDDAEDILQEVFVQVWRSASTYNATLGSLKTWLVRAAHNRAVDLLRSKRHRQRKLEVRGNDDGATEFPTPKSLVEDSTWKATLHNERSGYISTALAHLPGEQSTLIEMAFLHGYTHHEIAEQTGIPLGTVKTRIRTGMVRLRTHLSPLAEES